MKTKTIIELLTLSSSIYFLAKDSNLLERLSEMSEKGKERINKMASEPLLDEDGNELEFADKLFYKAGQLKDELEQKVEELVEKFYKKMNIAHLDEIKALTEKLEQADQATALLEARLNKLEAKLQ